MELLNQNDILFTKFFLATLFFLNRKLSSMNLESMVSNPLECLQIRVKPQSYKVFPSFLKEEKKRQSSPFLSYLQSKPKREFSPGKSTTFNRTQNGKETDPAAPRLHRRRRRSWDWNPSLLWAARKWPAERVETGPHGGQIVLSEALFQTGCVLSLCSRPSV